MEKPPKRAAASLIRLLTRAGGLVFWNAYKGGSESRLWVGIYFEPHTSMDREPEEE